MTLLKYGKTLLLWAEVTVLFVQTIVYCSLGHVWSDKSPVEFTNWNPQQPDSHQGQQPCVEMYSSGEWADTGCYSVKQFICKMPRCKLRKPTCGSGSVGVSTIYFRWFWLIWSFDLNSHQAKLKYHISGWICGLLSIIAWSHWGSTKFNKQTNKQTINKEQAQPKAKCTTYEWGIAKRNFM